MHFVSRSRKQTELPQEEKTVGNRLTSGRYEEKSGTKNHEGRQTYEEEHRKAGEKEGREVGEKPNFRNPKRCPASLAALFYFRLCRPPC